MTDARKPDEQVYCAQTCDSCGKTLPQFEVGERVKFPLRGAPGQGYVVGVERDFLRIVSGDLWVCPKNKVQRLPF